MTDIETEKFRQIGINLINEYRQQRGIRLLDWLVIDTPEVHAFIRSIQLHEKTKQELADCKQELSDFRQEVSDIVEAYVNATNVDDWEKLKALIIPKPKPDPLVEAIGEIDDGTWGETKAEYAAKLRAALDARGLEIREKNDDA